MTRLHNLGGGDSVCTKPHSYPGGRSCPDRSGDRLATPTVGHRLKSRDLVDSSLQFARAERWISWRGSAGDALAESCGVIEAHLGALLLERDNADAEHILREAS
jgi:hypothetical protein